MTTPIFDSAIFDPAIFDTGPAASGPSLPWSDDFTTSSFNSAYTLVGAPLMKSSPGFDDAFVYENERANGVAEYIGLENPAGTGPIGVMKFRFKTPMSPVGGDRPIASFKSGTVMWIVYLRSDGRVFLRVDNGGAFTFHDFVLTFVDTNWHTIDVELDCTTSANTMRLMLDGTAGTPRTVNLSPGTVSGFYLGDTFQQDLELVQYDNWRIASSGYPLTFDAPAPTFPWKGLAPGRPWKGLGLDVFKGLTA